MNEYGQAAADILTALGGRDNIRAATHCATRLRLVLNDESRVNQAALDALPITKGTFSNAGQYQIVLGTGTVNRVYAEFVRLVGVQEVSKEEAGALGGRSGQPGAAIGQAAFGHLRADYSGHRGRRSADGSDQPAGGPGPLF